jgi:hypothetical protein
MSINIRTLAAVDVAFLGPKLIVTEFGVVVVGPAALGTLTLLHARTTLRAHLMNPFDQFSPAKAVAIPPAALDHK